MKIGNEKLLTIALDFTCKFDPYDIIKVFNKSILFHEKHCDSYNHSDRHNDNYDHSDSTFTRTYNKSMRVSIKYRHF